MRETRHIRLWHPIAATGLILAAIAAQGCSDDPKPPDNSSSSSSASSSSSSGMGGSGGSGGGMGGGGGTGGMGGGGMTAVTPAANGAEFNHPFDATPDPAGDNVYFTGLDPTGEPAIFRAKLDGSEKATALVVGAPLVMPINIATSTDGGTIFITDTGADADPMTDLGDAGRIFSMANDSNVLNPLTAADGYRPHGLEVRQEGTGDVIYFAGTDPTDGQKGLFKVNADGSGAVTAVVKGDPFVDPSGLAIDGDKNIYVCDTVQQDGQGSLIAVTPAGVPSVLATNIRAGYPCGVSISPDESKVLVSSHDPMTDKSAVSLVDIATKAVTFFSMGIDQDIESGGLHGAKTQKNVYAWCGVTAGQTGTVYKVTLF